MVIFYNMKNKEDYRLRKIGDILARANTLQKENGLAYIVKLGTKLLYKKLKSYFVYYVVYKPFKSSHCFTFDTKTYKYFYHPYNDTWSNERIVEIPIILEILKTYKGENVLEIGNVLSHYVPVNHKILDKYEKGENILNEDIVDFAPINTYDLILSISTIEHVGYDEKPKDSNKIPQALKKIESLLTPQGKAVITIPLGYNPNLDTMINNSSLGFTKTYCLKRIGKGVWEETSFEKIRSPHYDNPSGILFIGILEK